MCIERPACYGAQIYVNRLNSSRLPPERLTQRAGIVTIQRRLRCTSRRRVNRINTCFQTTSLYREVSKRARKGGFFPSRGCNADGFQSRTRTRVRPGSVPQESTDSDVRASPFEVLLSPAPAVTYILFKTDTRNVDSNVRLIMRAWDTCYSQVRVRYARVFLEFIYDFKNVFRDNVTRSKTIRYKIVITCRYGGISLRVILQ